MTLTTALNLWIGMCETSTMDLFVWDLLIFCFILWLPQSLWWHWKIGNLASEIFHRLDTFIFQEEQIVERKFGGDSNDTFDDD